MNPSVVAKSQGAEDRQPEPAAELLAEAALSPLSGGEVNEFEASVGSKIGIGASSAEESLAAQLNSANPSQFSLAIGRCRALGERIPESDVLALSNYILSSMNRDHALEALAVLQTLGDRGRPAFEVLWNAGRFYLFEEAKTGPTLRGDLKGAIIGWGQNGQRFLIEKLQSGVPEHRSEAAAALVEGFAGSAEVELAVKQWIIDCAMRSEPHGVSASLCFLNGWFSPELSKFKLPEISAIDHDPIFRRVVIKMLWEVGSDYQGTAPRAADARNALKELGPEALVILPELEELLSSFVVKGLPYYLNGAQRVWNGLPTSDPPRSDWNDSAIKDLLRLYRDLTEMEGRASGSDGRKKTLELLTNLATADVPVEAASEAVKILGGYGEEALPYIELLWTQPRIEYKQECDRVGPLMGWDLEAVVSSLGAKGREFLLSQIAVGSHRALWVLLHTDGVEPQIVKRLCAIVAALPIVKAEPGTFKLPYMGVSLGAFFLRPQVWAEIEGDVLGEKFPGLTERFPIMLSEMLDLYQHIESRRDFDQLMLRLRELGARAKSTVPHLAKFAKREFTKPESIEHQTAALSILQSFYAVRELSEIMVETRSAELETLAAKCLIDCGTREWEVRITRAIKHASGAEAAWLRICRAVRRFVQPPAPITAVATNSAPKPEDDSYGDGPFISAGRSE